MGKFLIVSFVVTLVIHNVLSGENNSNSSTINVKTSGLDENPVITTYLPPPPQSIKPSDHKPDSLKYPKVVGNYRRLRSNRKHDGIKRRVLNTFDTPIYLDANSSVSSQYGAPEPTTGYSSPSSEYGARLSSKYAKPASSLSPTGSYSISGSSDTQGQPLSSYDSNQNANPLDSAGSSNSYSSGFERLSNSYDAPLSVSYGSPPSSPSNSYGSPKSSPISAYTLPPTSPSNSYGAPPSNSYGSPSATKYESSPSNSYSSPPSPSYGSPPSTSYVSPPSTSYGSPPSSSYGSPPSISYGSPPSISYGSPPSSSYGSPPSSSYGSPPSPPSASYGSPPSNSYGSPPSPPSASYGSPPSSSYGSPPSVSYGSPPSSSYGSPPTNSYGSPPPATTYGVTTEPSKELHKFKLIPVLVFFVAVWLTLIFILLRTSFFKQVGQAGNFRSLLVNSIDALSSFNTWDIDGITDTVVKSIVAYPEIVNKIKSP